MLFKKLFKRKVKKIDEETLNSMGIETAKIQRTEVERVESKKVSMMMKYRDVETGEIHEFDCMDFDAFDKIMSCKNNQLIFG